MVNYVIVPKIGRQHAWPSSAKVPTIFSRRKLWAFIREFRKHPVLYNTRHPLYHDRREKYKHHVLISRKLGFPGVTALVVKREIVSFKRNYITRFKELLQKKKEGRRFNPKDWWHATDKFYRQHVLDWKPELKALYVDSQYPDGNPRPKSPEEYRLASMAGIPTNWGAGVPKGGWGGWNPVDPKPIDLDALEMGKNKEAQLAKAVEEEEEKEAAKKRAKELEARGLPTSLTPEGPFPFLIDSHNFRMNRFPEVLEPANSKYHWNRLTVIGGAKVPKEKVLDAIIKSAAPAMLIPALYQTDGDDSFFLFRDGMIVSRLVGTRNNRLVIQDSSLENALEINFMIQYVSVEDEPLSPIGALTSAVNRRTNINNGDATVDLRNFQNDPEFKNLYVSFKTPRLVSQILGILVKKPAYRRLRNILLSHNDLDRLDVVEALISHEKPELKILDLRHNKLTYSGFERVSTLKSWNVHHLLIEGNPICEDYETPGETLYEMRKMIPSLKRLDGVDVDFVLDNRVNFKFYTRNPGYANFVDHFFHHYYSTFETEKDKLVQMYDSKACVSFSVCQNDRTPVPGNFFGSSNRNLISMSNVTKTYDNAFIGKTRIFDALTMMPNMKFDTYSFHIDLPHAFQNGTMLISCTGAFTLPDEPSQQIYTFARACILQGDSSVGCWKITNDMWTMMNALPPPNAKCFKLAKRAVKSDFAVMLNPLTKDKDVLKRVISELTHMKSAWVEKYLSDSGWDLECTLLSFIDHFKSHLIPFEAFLPFSAPA